MRIVATSDTHSKHKQVPIPDGDVFIHAGDLTPRGNYDEFISVASWFAELKNRFKHRIFIGGNHDFALEINSKYVLDDLFDSDVIYLQDKEIIIDGIKFYGTPWMPPYYDWAFMREEEWLEKCYAAIPNDVDVLITHTPPFGILDNAADDEKSGSLALRKRLEGLHQLKHHIFGHVHEAYGSEKRGDVTFHNVCALNLQYRYQNEPQVFDI
jgi:Icc-related predicted phosphoesterase